MKDEIFIYYNKLMGGNALNSTNIHLWLISHRIFIKVGPIDDWNCWCYTILLEDCLAPFFEARSTQDFEEYSTYEDALTAGLEEVYNMDLMIIPYPIIEPIEVDELSTTERGETGFGSTGK